MNRERHETDEPIICPLCSGYGYQDAATMGGPCSTCGASGWLMKSQLEEWEAENSPVDWTLDLGIKAIRSHQ